MMSDPVKIIGCGILKNEIKFLIKKNNWQNLCSFLPSGLHVDFERLEAGLEKTLKNNDSRPVIIFYGACHPRMDQILEQSNLVRTPGQNCVEILLGKEMFCRELEQGAFFLFEEWAKYWKNIVGGVMPGSPNIMRDIFLSSHKYLLAIRTPCSTNYEDHAEAVSEMTGLELRWIDAGLELLEENLAATIASVESDGSEDINLKG